MPISLAKRRCSSTSRPTMSCVAAADIDGNGNGEVLAVALHIGRIAEDAARGAADDLRRQAAQIAGELRARLIGEIVEPRPTRAAARLHRAHQRRPVARLRLSLAAARPRPCSVVSTWRVNTRLVCHSSSADDDPAKAR